MSGKKKGDGIRRDGKIVGTLAQSIVEYLDRFYVRAEVCGSVRRGLTDVGDVDLVVDRLYTAVEGVKHFCESRGLQFEGPEEMPSGRKTFSVAINGLQFDLYHATAEQWGAMKLFLTGSMKFNIATRGHAKKQGMKLSQYGLFYQGEIIAGRTEEQIFEALGLQYMPPSDRNLEADERLPLL